MVIRRMIFEDGPLAGALFESDAATPHEVRYSSPGGWTVLYRICESSAASMSDGTIWSEARYKLAKAAPIDTDPETARAIDFLIESTKRKPE